MGDMGGLWTATVEVIMFSEEEFDFSELLEVRIIDPVSLNFELITETGGAEGDILLSDYCEDESRIASVSVKNFLFTGFIGSIQHTFSSEVPE